MMMIYRRLIRWNFVVVYAWLLLLSFANLLPAAEAFSSSLPSEMKPQMMNRYTRNPSIQWSKKRWEISSPVLNAESNDVGDGTGGGLLLSDDASRSQLFSAFSSLTLTDQYDAVLTGLCAKILDTKSSEEEEIVTALKDPLQLLQEMSTQSIEASPRSLMALIDSTVKSQSAMMTAQTLSLASRNGGVRQYGSQQADILPLPSLPTTSLKCPDGVTRTRQERLDNVMDVPSDDREKEVAVAATFAGFCSFAFAVNALGLDEISVFTNTAVSTLLFVGVVDNFYDLLKATSKFLADEVGKKADEVGKNISKGDDNDSKKNKEENGEKKKKDKTSSGSSKEETSIGGFSLPDKESLPLGLGTGEVTGTVVRGMARLLTVDNERESECEAAALYAAYVLGLPCFAFRPNALEGSNLIVQSNLAPVTTAETKMDSLLTSSGILRMLIWIMAPVAMESSKYTQLLMSDPREAEGFLKRLEEDVRQQDDMALVEKQLKELWWIDTTKFQGMATSEKEMKDLIKWAYTEADLLLRDNRGAVTEISRRLAGGAATVGDCIAVLENW